MHNILFKQKKIEKTTYCYIHIKRDRYCWIYCNEFTTHYFQDIRRKIALG